jgi:hypothetical protein
MIKEMNIDTEKHLKTLFSQVKGIDIRQALAGLTILMKDTAEFLTAKGYRDPATASFRVVFLDTLNEDRFYWESFGPALYASLTDNQLPHGVVDQANRGQFDVTPVTKANNIFHEWTHFVGWCFFKKFSQKHGSAAIGEQGLAKDKQMLCTETEENVVKVAQRLLDKEFTDKGYWFPLVIFLALLIVRTKFETIAEPADSQ